MPANMWCMDLGSQIEVSRRTRPLRHCTRDQRHVTWTWHGVELVELVEVIEVVELVEVVEVVEVVELIEVVEAVEVVELIELVELQSCI